MTLSEQLQAWAEWRRPIPGCPQSPATWARYRYNREPEPPPELEDLCAGMHWARGESGRASPAVLVLQVQYLYAHLPTVARYSVVGGSASGYWRRSSDGAAILGAWLAARAEAPA